MTAPADLRRAHEQQTLAVLAEHYGYENECLFFWYIAQETGLDVKQVRRAVRSLARKGLAEYVRGLFDDDGQVAGSGYRCTVAGAELLTEATT